MPSSKPTAEVGDSKSEPRVKTTKARLQYLTTAEVYKPLSQKLRRESRRNSGALAASSTSARTKLPPEALQRQHRGSHPAEPGKVEQVEPAAPHSQSRKSPRNGERKHLVQDSSPTPKRLKPKQHQEDADEGVQEVHEDAEAQEPVAPAAGAAPGG